jgi:hypothetical protein
MSDINLERLQAKRQQIASDLEKVDAAIAKYLSAQRAIAELVADLDLSEVRPVVTHTVGSSVPHRYPMPVDADEKKRNPRGSSPADITSKARELILKSGAPIPRSALVKAIEAAGLVIGAADKAKGLGTIMWRSKQFVTTDKGYWPNDVPLPDDISLNS